MDGEALLRKLQIRPGARLRLIAAPGEVAEALRGRVVAAGPGEACDAALAFCETPAEVAVHAADAMGALAPDGILWFAYRKGAAARSSGLSRDVGWGALAERGYRPVRSIAFDEVWTGLRFRESSKVKSSG